MDALGASRARLVLDGFQCRDLCLVGAGDLLAFRPDQRSTLVEIVLLSDKASFLLSLKFLFGIRVGGL
ncbi:hypothetical protein D3C81_2250930 [compost metagenome]